MNNEINEIKEGFHNLAIEREKLTKALNDKGDIGTKRLKCWPLFIAACVIAENYHSDVRKKLKLDIASGYLDNAKLEMEQYGIHHDDFINVENALKSVINAIGKLVTGQYKSSMVDVREGAMGTVSDRKLGN